MKFLNNKQTKNILSMIKARWGCDFPKDYVFIQNKEKILIVNKDIAKLDFEKIRVNRVGLYVAEISNDEIRLSIEGSQMIGKKAIKNVLDLQEQEARDWIRGNDLDIEAPKGFFIIKYKNDFLGSGKSMGDKILNFVPKTRRINMI